MNAIELRIDNLVKSTLSGFRGKPLVIFGIESENIVYLGSENYRTSIDHLKPIKLSEDWLINFDFEKVEEERFYKKQIGNNLSLFVDIYNKSYGINLDWKDSSYIEIWRNLDYVHNLQNLYFALTNEELKLIKNS